MAREFVNSIVAREADQDFIACKLSIRAVEFKDFINSQSALINANNGWLNIEVLKSKDRTKLYCQLNDWKPEKVDSKKQNPDRDTGSEDDDLPF